MKKVPATGSPHSRIMIVGEAPGADEERLGEPFVGSSGKLLNEMLREAGLSRSECFITNVSKFRPPNNKVASFFLTKTQAHKAGIAELNGRYPKIQITDGLRELEEEIEKVNPKIIIALGATAMWALTGQDKITQWRGSWMKLGGVMKETIMDGVDPFILPTFHPAFIMRQWQQRFVAIQDLRRITHAKKYGIQKPNYNFIVSPSVGEVNVFLNRAIAGGKCAVDIETLGGHILCIGVAISKTEAICIPFIDADKSSYWTLEEEHSVVQKLRQLFQTTKCTWQNGAYDSQYICYWWQIIPPLSDDTMIMQHTAFPDKAQGVMRKGLDFLSSMYCDYHEYWKDELKDWKKFPSDMIQLWTYNCKDCVITYESEEVLNGVLKSFKLWDQYQEQLDFSRTTIRMMIRGVLINQEKRNIAGLDVMNVMYEKEQALIRMGDALQIPNDPKKKPWYRSPTQMQDFFYNTLKLPVQREKGRPTFNAAALKTLQKKEPLLIPLFQLIEEYRSLGVTFSTFISGKLTSDGRIRCSYKTTGTDTFRFASAKDAFGSGGNLQNIPSGTEDK